MPSGAPSPSSTPRVAGPQILPAPALSTSTAAGAPDDSRTAAGGADGHHDAVPAAESSISSWEAIAPKGMSLTELCARMHERVDGFLGIQSEDERIKAVQAQVRNSLGVIREALVRYRLDELSLSYNGGKDCLVLLILYLAALHPHSQQTQQSQPSASSQQPSAIAPNTSNNIQPSASFPLPPALEAVYIISPHPFPEIDAFVTTTATHTHLSLSRYALPMKAAFTSYLADAPQIRAIFVGTRRTDPHGAALEPFLETDHGWPGFMRVHPVLEWRYAEIWTFLRGLQVPYCGLYDLGYTSLGGTTDTFPNPVLKVKDRGEEREGFRPAYELLTDEEERWGRS